MPLFVSLMNSAMKLRIFIKAESFLLAEHLLDSQEGLCTTELTVFFDPNILSSTFSLQLLKCKQSQKVFPMAMCYHKRDTFGNFLWTSVFFRHHNFS